MYRWKAPSRRLVAAFLFLVFTAGAYAQNERLGKIAILPFTGGTLGEREGIPELFSFTPGIKQNFAVIPRTGITNAAEQEQSFQATSGMTDAETIARLGNQVGADYVMAGSITSLGSKNLLIVSIVKIDVIRQIAGVYLVYDSLDALNKDDAIVNTMAEELVAMARAVPGGLDGLALLPVELQEGGNKEEGDALAQILAIHLLRVRKYAVYPRTGTLDQVISEYETQLKSGVTRAEEAVKTGQAVNPPYVLSVISRKIASTPRFNAAITDLSEGIQIAGESEQYASLSDGIPAMEFLALKLSGEEVSDQDRRARAASVEREISDAARTAEAAEQARARAEAVDRFLKNAGIGFAGWWGPGFGDVPTVEKLDKETGKTKKTQDFPWLGGIELDLRLFRFLGIQTGANLLTGYGSYTPPGEGKKYAPMNLLQIPLLLRLNFMSNEMDMERFYFSVHGGIGINAVVINTTETLSVDPGELGLILGAEAGAGIMGPVSAFIGYRYCGSLGKGAIDVSGVFYDYAMSIHILQIGLRVYLPFR